MTLAEPHPEPRLESDAATSSAARTGERVHAVDEAAPRLPTQNELPYGDGEPLESKRHRLAMELLINSLEPWLERRYRETGDGGFVGGNMFLYFSEEQVKGRHVRGPDVMVVLGVEPGERKNWVTWGEGQGPQVVIELLSDSTKVFDKEAKPWIYRDEVKVREYYWFDPFHPEDFAGFSFSDNERALPGARGGSEASQALEPLEPNLEPDDDGRITSEALGLRLGSWKGRHVGVDAVWLRWYTLEGELLLTEEAQRTDEEAQRADEEARRADEEAQRADEEAQRADEEARRANKLADTLRALGIDPAQIV